MKKLFLTLIATIILSTGLAQIVNIQGMDNVVIRTKKYDNIKGTAYLYPSWSSGTITDKSGKVYSNLLLKYDTYKDLVELNQDGQVMEVNILNYPKFTLSWTEPGSNEVKKHSFVNGFTIEGFTKANYFDVLYEGQLDLMKKYKTTFVEESVTGYGTSDSQKSFQLNSYYFLMLPDNTVKEIKLNRKSILEALPNESTTIEAYMKEKKVKLKSEAELLDLIKYLDSK